jgi:HSP20 family protein
MDFSKRFGKDFGELGGVMGRILRTTSFTRMVQLQSGSDWRPAVDVYETENDIYICVDTAGVDAGNIAIAIAENKIVISGHRNWPLRKNLCRIHQLEIEHGYFERTISFPVSVDVTTVSSGFSNGILEIKFPKK